MSKDKDTKRILKKIGEYLKEHDEFSEVKEFENTSIGEYGFKTTVTTEKGKLCEEISILPEGRLFCIDIDLMQPQVSENVALKVLISALNRSIAIGKYIVQVDSRVMFRFVQLLPPGIDLKKSLIRDYELLARTTAYSHLRDFENFFNNHEKEEMIGKMRRVEAKKRGISAREDRAEPTDFSDIILNMIKQSNENTEKKEEVNQAERKEAKTVLEIFENPNKRKEDE